MDSNTQLIRKYLDGISTEDENRALYEWISESERNFTEFRRIKREHDSVGIITAGAQSPQQARRTVGEKIRRRLRRRRLGYVAAVSAAVLAGAFIFGRFGRVDGPPPDEVAYHTGRGQQKGITLPDGSVVTLNAESRLSYIFDDDRGLRQVFLTGEAFFDVVRDTLNPFIVRTDYVDARVLGTMFNMSSYPDDRVVETTVMEGRVALSIHGSGEGSVEVTANDRATLVKGDGAFRLDRLDASLVAQWMDGVLAFREARLDDIVRRLERHYDISITLDGRDLGRMVYTATFDKGTPIENILKLFALTSPIEYGTDGGGIVIKPAKRE